MLSANEYKALLRKYIRHVADSEGTCFIGPYGPERPFTDEEWAELRALEVEVEADLAKEHGPTTPLTPEQFAAIRAAFRQPSLRPFGIKPLFRRAETQK